MRDRLWQGRIISVPRRRSIVRTRFPRFPILIGLLLWGACQDPGQVPPVSLTVAMVGDALTLDPAAISDSESMQVAIQIFEPLVRYEKAGESPEPALAIKWEESRDQKSWTFHLRRKVLFHDGTALDAAAVVASFERQRDPRHKHHFKNFTYWQSTFRNIKKVEQLDPYRVRIRLDRPHAPFLHDLAMFPVSIVSPRALDRWGREFSRHPVGTGPFSFARWERGRRIKLKKNPNYWGKAPAVDNLIFEVIPESRHRMMGLESGRVDVAQGLKTADRQLVSLHPEMVRHRLLGNNVAYLALNTQRAPFDDARVRWAVNFAVNKRAIVKLVYQGLAVEAIGPIPPGMWGRNPKVTTYRFDPAQARLMLKSSGYVAKQPPRLYVMSTPRQYLPSPVLVARMIARNLADVGLPVELVVKPLDEYLTAIQNGEHDLCLAGWTGDNWDPDNFLYMLLDRDNARPGSVRNLAMYTNLQVHELLIGARREHDKSLRESAYRRAQEIIADDAPWVPLAHTNVEVASRATVRHLRANTSMAIFYRDVVKEAGSGAR